MMQDLYDIQLTNGAVFDATSDLRIPISFGNDAAAIEAARQGVALVDRSQWGLLKLSGEDRLRYLHNQSTNTFQNLQPGQGCDTVFVSSTARTIDLATTYVTEDAVLILVSPQRRQTLMEWLDRFIFPMDRVELNDYSDENAIFSLIGPESEALLNKIGIQTDSNAVYASHQQFSLDDMTLRVAVGNSVALPGYTVIVCASDAAKLWQRLTQAEAIPMGEHAWEQLRIEQGRPMPDYELTEEYNPLETGLWQTISFEKGCYIGQETIARLHTYKGVKQHLWGVRLTAPVEPGTVVTLEGNKIGQLTSYTNSEQGPFGLAYIRSKAGGVGLQVKVGEVEGEVVEVPFVTPEYP